MKLKKIYITLFTLAALTACSNEVIDGPEITKSQEVPSALVLGTDMGNSLTKASTEKKNPTLFYAFVFDKKTGECIGANKSASKDLNKATLSTVITGIENSHAYLDFNETEVPSVDNIKIGENEVVIDGFSMKIGGSLAVQVLLIANPLGSNIETLDSYLNTNSIKELSISKFRGLQFGISDQLWEEQSSSDTHTLVNVDDLTATQWFEMNLQPGINCLGKREQESKEIDKDWFNRSNITIPLYRLVAQVDLTVNNNITDAGEGDYFSIIGVRPSKVSSSSCVPDNFVNLSSVSGIDYKDENVIYDYWCKPITNTLGSLFEIQLARYIDDTEIASNYYLETTYYIFGQASKNKLEVFGEYYKYVNGKEVKTYVTYTYDFPEDFEFLRNKKYTVEMTITKAPDIDGEVIQVGNNRIKLEIANMIDSDYKVSFE